MYAEIPPSLARAMAIEDSETVSIAAETIGILSLIFFEKYVEISTSLGKISEYEGTTKTSSNARPSEIIFTF